MKTFFVPVLLAVSLTGMAAAQDAAPPAPPAPAPHVAPVVGPAPMPMPAPVTAAAPAAQPAAPLAPPAPAAPAWMMAQAAPPAPSVAPVPPAPPMPPMPPGNWYAPGKGSYLGVGVQEIDSDRAKELKLSEPYGVEVTTVADDSPAAKAGIKEDDLVLEFNGQRVEGVEQFVRLVRETPPGRTVKLLVNRNGANRTVTATVGDCKAFLPDMDPKFAEKMRKLAEEMARKGKEMEREFGADSKFRQDMEKQFGQGSKFRQDMDNQFGQGSQFQRDMQKLGDDMKNMHWDWEWHGPEIGEMPGTHAPRLGIESEPVSSQLAEFFGVKQGVLVRSVTDGSGAAKAGIKAGDVIVKVGDSEVGSPREITKALRDAEAGKPVPVTVVRNKRQMTLNVTPGGKPGAGH